MPVKCIRKFQQNVTNISASADNTVLIDFCSGNDECVLATMESVLKSKKIQLTGGTAWEGLVCCNGQVYEDACAYALVKNESGFLLLSSGQCICGAWIRTGALGRCGNDSFAQHPASSDE